MEIHTREIHTREIHTGEIHTREVHAGEIHTREMYTGEIHFCFGVQKTYEPRTLSCCMLTSAALACMPHSAAGPAPSASIPANKGTGGMFWTAKGSFCATT